MLTNESKGESMPGGCRALGGGTVWLLVCLFACLFVVLNIVSFGLFTFYQLFQPEVETRLSLFFYLCRAFFCFAKIYVSNFLRYIYATTEHFDAKKTASVTKHPVCAPGGLTTVQTPMMTIQQKYR